MKMEEGDGWELKGQERGKKGMGKQDSGIPQESEGERKR